LKNHLKAKDAKDAKDAKQVLLNNDNMMTSRTFWLQSIPWYIYDNI